MNLVTLDSVLNCLESGSRPRGGVTKETGDIPSLGGEHINNRGGFNFKNLKFIPSDFYVRMSSGKIKPEDILIVKDGATTGKTSFVKQSFPYACAAINEHVFRLDVNGSLAVPSYVFHFLFSAAGQSQILLDFRGATVGGISRNFVNKVRLPLPPLPEQKKIAAILDKADALREKRRQTIAKLDAMLQAIFLYMFGNPERNEKGWPVKRLVELCRSITDIDHKMPKSVEQGIPFISAKDLLDSGQISFDNVKRISEEDFRRLSRKSKPEKGDIIYSRIGVNLGKARMVNVDYDFLASYSCCTVKPNQELVNSTFLCNLLDSPFILRQAHKGVRAIAVPDLGIGEIKDFRIISPPMSLQREYARRVGVVDHLKTAHRASLARMDELFASLQQRAFNGDLFTT
jgi:type I restriction enzyme, S subunit